MRRTSPGAAHVNADFMRCDEAVAWSGLMKALKCARICALGCQRCRLRFTQREPATTAHRMLCVNPLDLVMDGQFAFAALSTRSPVPVGAYTIGINMLLVHQMYYPGSTHWSIHVMNVLYSTVDRPCTSSP